jgi:hypothetical protein
MIQRVSLLQYVRCVVLAVHIRSRVLLGRILRGRHQAPLSALSTGGFSRAWLDLVVGCSECECYGCWFLACCDLGRLLVLLPGCWAAKTRRKRPCCSRLLVPRSSSGGRCGWEQESGISTQHMERVKQQAASNKAVGGWRIAAAITAWAWRLRSRYTTHHHHTHLLPPGASAAPRGGKPRAKSQDLLPTQVTQRQAAIKTRPAVAPPRIPQYFLP